MFRRKICSCSRSLVIALIPLTVTTSLNAEDFSLSEVVSWNDNTFADEDGDYGDWIELHNPGVDAADLGGWGLSDSPSSPFKWEFPASTIINGGGYLLVWASSKDRNNPAAPLHTNFSLSKSGERIVLTRPAGTLADEVDLPGLTRGTSFGRLPGMGTSWFYFEAPTPGTANSTPGYPDPTLPPTFSHDGGFYTSAFSLDLTVPPGWEVYYTLDGSVPDPSRVGAGAEPYRETLLYGGGISVASRAGDPNVFSAIDTTDLVQPWLPEWQAPSGEVFKATVTRAVAHDPATGRTSRILTRSYFVDANIMTRYNGLPVISLVSDYENLFDDDTGIYVPGTTHGGDLKSQNFFLGWVRSANLEYFEPDGTPGFSDVFEITNQGSSSPAGMQKGLHVSTGDESVNSRINYPLFATSASQASQLTEFKRFMLRAWGSARSWEVFFADAYHQTLVATSGLEIQDYRPVIVFINGEYWGLHEVREANKNSWYHEFRTGIDRTDPGYDLLDEGGTEVDEGDSLHWDAVNTYIDTNDLSDDLVYQYVTTQIDVENLAEYVVHCIFTGKRDWPPQNESLWRSRTPEGRWRWVQYDMDQGLNDWAKPEYDLLAQTLDGAPEGYGPHALLVKLLANPTFERLFVNTYLDWLNTYFLDRVALARFDAMKTELEPHIAEFDARWPNTYNFQTGTAYGRNIVDRRRHLRRTQLRDRFALGDKNSITLLADPSMGLIRCNSILVNESTPGVSPDPPYPWQRSYYENMPIEIEAIPNEEQRFLGWHASISGVPLPPLAGSPPPYYTDQPIIDVQMTDHITMEAVFEAIPLVELPGPVHVWNFENGSLFAPSLTAGGGLLSVVPATGLLLEPSEKEFDDSHLRVNNPIGTEMIWAMPTTGFETISLDFSTRRSGSGAGLQELSYTLDGTGWTVLDTYSVADSSPQPQSFDFSGISGVDDNPDFAIRITFAQGSGGTAGNNRFDNVVLTGTALAGAVPPTVTAPIPPKELVAGSASVLIDLENYFEDLDGDPLVFQAESASPLATATVNGLQLSVSGVSAGETQIIVSAMADGVPAASQSFGVLVYPAPFPVATGVFRFTDWSSGEPTGSYPDHMLFLQTEVSDPNRSSTLNHAYTIPATDADFPEDAAFPYAAISRTRINGLGDQGISFINTGRDRDVGAALVALDTTGQSNIELRWTAGTVAVNSRIYGLRLQYRLDIADPWTDLLDGSLPLEYTSSTVAGDEVAFGPVLLPPALENQPDLQLQWQYHYISGLGTRAEIRLDDIVLYAARTYDDWVTDSFSPPDAANPAVSGPSVEYLGDGYSNLMKYALGVAPSSPITTGQLDLGALPDGRLFARFHLDRTLSDITYRVESSPDLLNWSDLFDSDSFWEANSHGATHEVIAPPGGGPRQFLRLKVEEK